MSKKKATYLTLAERVEIIERLERGERGVHLAIAYGITSSSICAMKKNKENILKQKALLDARGSSAKRIKYSGVEVSPRDRLLFAWMKQQRDIGKPVSLQVLAEKAKIINEALSGPSDFKACQGYLIKFKKRHSLADREVEGQKLSAETVAIDKFTESFSRVRCAHNYDLDHVYNADETGLYWNMPTDATLKSDDPNTEETQLPEARVTLMVCTNASGTHKIPPLVIGTRKSPQSLKNTRDLPVHYRRQRNAWITKDLTRHWYEKIFLPAAKKHHGADHKFLLLLDGASGHPSVGELETISNQCKIVYVPRDIPAVIQPMNQGIIEKLKKVYKIQLLHFLLSNDGKQGGLKAIGMADVLDFVLYSWDRMLPGNIRYAWKNFFPVDPLSTGECTEFTHLSGRNILHMIQGIPGCEGATRKDADNWLDCDGYDPGWKVRSLQEIINGQVVDPDEDIKVEDGNSDEDYAGDAEECADDRGPGLKSSPTEGASSGWVNLDEDKIDVKEEEITEATCAEDSADEDVNERDALRGMRDVMKYFRTTPHCTAEHVRVLEEVEQFLVRDAVAAQCIALMDYP